MTAKDLQTIKKKAKTFRLGSLMKGGIPIDMSGPMEKKKKEKTLISSSKALTRFSSL